MQLLLAAATIFLLRATDVTVGTIRSLYAVRGRRVVAAALGLLESSIFILAISKVMTGVNDPVKMIGYALGFSAGVFMGITIERWIASGTILARIVTRAPCPHLIDGLRQQAFGVTELAGTGRAGDVRLFFVVAPRKREKELLTLVERLEPEAFVTIDAVNHALGGYLTPTPAGPAAAGVRK
jgi:uncharacterized protein YebE (UPF0316 family)